MSRGLIKANQVILKEEEIRVIDSNSLVAEKMEKIHSRLLQGSEAGGFQSGLNAAQVETILNEEGLPEGEAYSEGFVPMDPSAMTQIQEPVYTGPSPEELIAEAESQIEEMKLEARQELESMREYTMEEWRQQGFREGQKQAVEELEKEKAVLKQQAAKLEAEYQEKINRLEPEFIEVLTGIYEQIFKVELKDYKPILVHAITNSIRNIEGGKDFIVHVSKGDYPEVSKAKQDIFAGLATTSASLEIIEDMTLGPNECMIETSNGIYDCGIGSQLEELTRRLRLLSYER
ncbi:MAG: hypothetical protein IJP31_06835 [Lachnospiraceae bacterium]|nr:hypothetical protein [Lachnospiraceae bacterium]